MKSNARGKLINKLEVTSGVSNAGKEWQKQTIVIEEVNDKYTNLLAIDILNKVVDAMDSIQVGTVIDLDIDVESKEYNGRWYTTNKAWRFTAQAQSTRIAQASQPMASPSGENDDGLNDMPF